MSARILLIEDNAPNLELMTYLLRAHGHAPTGVMDPMAGVRAAREGEYDLVVTDMLMPGMDGHAILMNLRSVPCLANTKIVAVTALAMVGDRERILSAGFDGYLAKPIEPETFVRDIEAFLPESERPQAQAQFERAVPLAGAAAANGQTILVVDDVALNRELIRTALTPLGYQVVEARDTSEARARLHVDAPALVLCDVHMPGGTGLEFAAEVKSDPALRSIPFLFISSTMWRTAERRRAAELGAGDLVLRPIDPDKLQREVMRVLQVGIRAEDPHS